MIKQYDSEDAFWSEVKVGDVLQLSREGDGFVRGEVVGEWMNSYSRKKLLDVGIQMEVATFSVTSGEWRSSFTKLEKLKQGKVIAQYPTPKKSYIVKLRSGSIPINSVTEDAAIQKVKDAITKGLNEAGFYPIIGIVLTAEEV